MKLPEEYSNFNFEPPGVDQTEQFEAVAPASDPPRTEFPTVSEEDTATLAIQEPLPLTQVTGSQGPSEEPIQVPAYRFPEMTLWRTRRSALTEHLHDEHGLSWLAAEGVDPQNRYRNKGYLVELHDAAHEGTTGHVHGNEPPQTNTEGRPGNPLFSNALPPKTRIRRLFGRK